jgi:hypothetical protein
MVLRDYPNQDLRESRTPNGWAKADSIVVRFEKNKLISNGQNLAKQTRRKYYSSKILFQTKINFRVNHPSIWEIKMRWNILLRDTHSPPCRFRTWRYRDQNKGFAQKCIIKIYLDNIYWRSYGYHYFGSLQLYRMRPPFWVWWSSETNSQ